MKKLLVYIFVIITFISGCSFDKQNTLNIEIANEETVKERNSQIDLEVNVEQVIEEEIRSTILDLNLNEKIGQLFIAGFENTEISEREKDLLETQKIGGFIFFKRNIINYEQTLRLANSLKESNANNKIPLFLAIDEEGGRVSRLNEIFINFPPVSELGIKNSLISASDYGQIQALKLISLGLNLNFSPVLDVNTNPENIVIGDRAISDNPEIVAILGGQIFTSMMEEGVVPVGKHYPGHGNTLLDSHYDMPIITKSKDELEEIELLPFKYAIDKNIPGIMIGHLYLKNLSDMPASLSSEVITGLLREEQDFKGLVFSDDLTMGAISEAYDIGDAAVKFLIAGGDIALICHGDDNIYKAISSVKNALEEGKITEREIDDKLFRIIKTKNDFDLRDKETLTIDIKKINNMMDNYLMRGE